MRDGFLFELPALETPDAMAHSTMRGGKKNKDNHQRGERRNQSQMAAGAVRDAAAKQRGRKSSKQQTLSDILRRVKLSNITLDAQHTTEQKLNVLRGGLAQKQRGFDLGGALRQAHIAPGELIKFLQQNGVEAEYLFEVLLPSASGYFDWADALTPRPQNTGRDGSSAGGIRKRRPNGKPVRVRPGSFGEIKPATSKDQKRGDEQLKKHKTKKDKVLVTYEVDRAKRVAHIRMLITNPRSGGAGRWNYVGHINLSNKLINLYDVCRPYFGRDVEPQIRNYVLRKTDFSQLKNGKHGNAPGPDIVFRESEVLMEW